MIISADGYHLLSTPSISTEILVDVEGTLGSGRAVLMYKIGDEYFPLVGGNLKVGKTYILSQRYQYPIYVFVTGSENTLSIALSVSGRPLNTEITQKQALLPNSYVFLYGVVGVQVGQAIITGETVWEDSEGIPTFDLLDQATAFDAGTYPVLALVYPSLVTPTLPTETGSPFPYKIVADYTGA